MKFDSPPPSPRLPRRPEDWFPEARLRAVMEASRLSEEELGAFLRREGISEAILAEHVAQSTSNPARRKALAKQANRFGEQARQMQESRDWRDVCVRAEQLERALRQPEDGGRAPVSWACQDDGERARSSSSPGPAEQK